MTNSNNLLYLISIDSFFNGLLFLLIFNIKLSKKDKIEYYGSMIISSKERYIYFVMIWLISITLSLLFFTQINISILIMPILVYYIRHNNYFKSIVRNVDRIIGKYTQKILSSVIYFIIQFLSKTILCEVSNVREEEIVEFYKRVGYSKLIEFSQSFVIACVYEYITVYYGSLSYLFNYGGQFEDNYDKKQYILGLLNEKNWEKLFSSRTISLFFDIYRTSNNKQISKYIQYQLTRFQYKLLIFFSIWSLVSLIGNNILIPILFYYIYIEEWKDHRCVFISLSIISVLSNISEVVSIFLFILPPRFYENSAIYLWSIPRDNCLIFWMSLFSFGCLFETHSHIFFFIVSIILNNKYITYILLVNILGYFSNYNPIHIMILFLFSIGYSSFKLHKEQNNKKNI